MFVKKVWIVAGEFRVVMEDVDELVGCLGTDALQDFALPSQLFRVGLWQCRAGGDGAILRLSCVFVQETFALGRLSRGLTVKAETARADAHGR